MHITELGFTDEQLKILQEIYQKAKKLEELDNTGKKKLIIAIIEGISNGYIDLKYIIEKLELLFKINLELKEY